jgi:protein ImuA
MQEFRFSDHRSDLLGRSDLLAMKNRLTTAAEKVAAIRGSLAGTASLEKHVRVPLGHDAADACLKGGLRRGALHEIFAQGGHEAAASCFAAALAGRVCGRRHLLWIRQDFSALEFGELAGTGLLELGIDPGRVLLLRVDDATAALRAGIDALSCAELNAVVIEIPGDPRVLDLTASRRLTLSSAQSNVSAILLRFSAKPGASTAETRWLIRGVKSSEEEDWGKPVFEAHLVRNRSGQPGCWRMEWSCDDGLFQAAHSGAVVPAASDRQAAAPCAFVA